MLLSDIVTIVCEHSSKRECTVHLISRQTMGWLRTDYIVSEGRDALGILRGQSFY